MIDLSGDTNKYYYHVINSTDVTNATSQINQDGEASYDLSLFETMGAYNSSIYFDDAQANIDYYDTTTRTAAEEFIFILDFEDTAITTDALNNTILLEMENSTDETMISVLDIEQATQVYSIYANKDAIIDINGELSSTTIYSGQTVLLDLQTAYQQQKIGTNTIFDTLYFDAKEGIKISLINSDGEVVTGASLLGLTYTIGESTYYPNIDGTTRIKISDKVGNARKWIRIATGTSNIPTGYYTLRVEAYCSTDGIYYGLTTTNTYDFTIYIINEIYGLNLITTPEEMIIESATGLNQNDENTISYTLEYNSGITSPNVRIKMYRRDYVSTYDTTFTAVDFANYFSDELTNTGTYEYLVTDDPENTDSIEFTLKENLVTGTYRLEFILYDDNTLIGSVEKYIIIK